MARSLHTTTIRPLAERVPTHDDESMTSSPVLRALRIHPAWIVAVATFLTMIGAAGFRSAPGVFMPALHDEFGWEMGTMSLAVSINLVLYGLAAPFSAALMERFGIRRVAAVALLLIALGAILPIWMTAQWQLLICWGLLIGLGSGSVSMALVATITGRWFVARRGLVTGVLTAAAATGQLVFLPLMATLLTHHGWRSATLVIGCAALLIVPVVLIFLRDRPSDVGVTAYGATPAQPALEPVAATPGLAFSTLRDALRTRTFLLLAATFAVCGASTNGLVGTHFIPAAMDHGMAETAAASLLALVGVFDIVGTIFSGWLTDRFDPRILLAAYYGLRGLSLFLLPSLFGDSMHPSMLVFVLFYGLDWVATVPPTMALCRSAFGNRAPIVFGWVFACHQLGAAAAATVAGTIRDDMGTYNLAFYGAGVLCLLATLGCLSIKKRPVAPEPEPDPLGAAV